MRDRFMEVMAPQNIIISGNYGRFFTVLPVLGNNEDSGTIRLEIITMRGMTNESTQAQC